MILANFTLLNRFSRALPHPLCGSPLPEGAKDRLNPLPRLFDKPQFETHSHKIPSVDLCHKIPSLHNLSIPTPCLNLKNKSHPVKSALARTLGVSVPKLVTVGMHFRIESENAPSLFGRVARNLSRKKGFSGCFPLVSFLCRSKGKYTKKQTP
jgi:hypothetical protein